MIRKITAKIHANPDSKKNVHNRYTQILTDQVQLLHDLFPIGRGLSRRPHPRRVHDEQSHCHLRLISGGPPSHSRRYQDVPAREVHAARQVRNGLVFSHVGVSGPCRRKQIDVS